jgi:hypothetical protein
VVLSRRQFGALGSVNVNTGLTDAGGGFLSEVTRCLQFCVIIVMQEHKTICDFMGLESYRAS